MRKKELLNQNVSLFDQLQKVKADNARLQSENARLKEKNAELKNAIEERFLLEKADTAYNEEPETAEEDKAVNAEFEYAAAVIGKIVVKSAEYSNKLTLGGETKYIELVNLILGRAEVAKAEILSVVSSADEADLKAETIDNIFSQTSEYFESVMAQRL